MARLNQIIRAVAAAHPDMRVVDLNAYLASLPGGELDPALRPDGVHFTFDTTRQVAAWLGPAVVAAASGR
jgi:hypothetical protein